MAEGTRAKEVQKMVEIAIAEEKGQRLILEHQFGDMHRLALPPGAKVHSVFHVSQLKKKIGLLTSMTVDLPTPEKNGNFQIYPLKIISRRLIKKKGVAATEWLIQWVDSSPEEAMWEDAASICARFPDLDPWGQGSSKGGGNVMSMMVHKWEIEKEKKKREVRAKKKMDWLQRKLEMMSEKGNGFGPVDGLLDLI